MSTTQQRSPVLRLDTIPAGSLVTLQFHSQMNEPSEEKAIFLGIEGEGNERRARFVQRNGQATIYEWEAYRFNGHWAYGSSADRLSLLDSEDVLV